MRLCLVMLGRFEVKNGAIYGDQKNINVILRYLKYFDRIEIIARKTNKESIMPRIKVELPSEKVSFNLYDDMTGGLDYFRHTKDFKNVLNKTINNVDLVLCWAEWKSNYVVRTSKKNNKKSVVYVGGCNRDILRSSKSLIRKFASFFMYYSNRKAIKNSDYVHYVTHTELQKRYPTNGKSLAASYVNVNLDIPQEIIDRRYNRYYEKRVLRLGLIGYLNEVKGIDTAIKAASHLNFNFELRILGGGNPEKFKKLAYDYGVSDKIHFEGTLPPGPAVLEWLDSVDIYIQPSRTEGLPRATIEAMSRGCPVITSDAMGLIEITDNKYIHSANDHLKLSILLNELANNNKELIQQSKRSFNISKRYNRANLDKKIDLFFEMIKDELKSEY